MQQDEFNLLWWLIWFFSTHDVMMEVSKADISYAYGRLPMAPAHHLLTAAMMVNGELFWSHHKAMPVGAVASC